MNLVHKSRKFSAIFNDLEHFYLFSEQYKWFNLFKGFLMLILCYELELDYLEHDLVSELPAISLISLTLHLAQWFSEGINETITNKLQEQLVVLDQDLEVLFNHL